MLIWDTALVQLNVTTTLTVPFTWLELCGFCTFGVQTIVMAGAMAAPCRVADITLRVAPVDDTEGAETAPAFGEEAAGEALAGDNPPAKVKASPATARTAYRDLI